VIAAPVTVVGTGHHLPERVEDNVELARRLGIDPAWIVEKTGITGRRLAGHDDTASGFATAAARRALDRAGVRAEEVDLIVVCTFSGDYAFPPVSAKVHALIGATGAQCFDVQANCSGFVHAMTIASDRMRCDPSVRNSLVIGVELCSRYIDGSDVNTAIYLSDGAGAVLLGRHGDPGSGLLASAFHTDPSNFEAVRLRGGGSSFAFHGRPFDPAVDLMEMNGVATWKQAITHLPAVIRRACAKAELDVADVDQLILHQANYNLISYVVRKMGLPMDRTYTNVREIGNTGSASIAVALSQAVEAGVIDPGATVVLAGVGAGFTFGASVWRWPTTASGSRA
jgi:3-oxoacyl-[acyl-carrier-protein] synthase-3